LDVAKSVIDGEGIELLLIGLWTAASAFLIRKVSSACFFHGFVPRDLEMSGIKAQERDTNVKETRAQKEGEMRRHQREPQVQPMDLANGYRCRCHCHCHCPMPLQLPIPLPASAVPSGPMHSLNEKLGHSLDGNIHETIEFLHTMHTSTNYNISISQSYQLLVKDAPHRRGVPNRFLLNFIRGQKRFFQIQHF
jgi:hypothetical protein